MSAVTVILNGFKRPNALQEQYSAIQNQTHKNIEMMFWGNYDADSFSKFSIEILSKCSAALCNKNLGVWARFAYALNANTDYICMLDDDTIPGNKWIEYCLNTIQNNPGLIGGRGVRFIDENYRNYPSCTYDGVGRGNLELKRVDIIGHSWFFHRDWLRYYWLEMPMTRLPRGGEDMHFSYVLQKYLKLYSYIPPQPENDPELWASKDPSKYGEDKNATSLTMDGHIQANNYWNFILDQGYQLAKDSI